ncbi:hypothetical protein N7535_008423 [Penicillium sp. DV-2018c]|nr:hypothetical protein N7461_002180 [Penicillium sp. DV-2018c]KAJ5563259.1 hypothetical protein N7535_008423 [Penicillium sp. DV-2018c]
MKSLQEQMLDALKVTPSMRILGVLRTAGLDSKDYLASVSAKIEGFVAALNEIAETRFLAVQVRNKYTYFVLDINNDQYDYQTAHLRAITLPVYRLQYSSRRWHLVRDQRQDASLADEIASLHDCNGQNPTPFLEDITNNKNPTYLTPRSQIPI